MQVKIGFLRADPLSTGILQKERFQRFFANPEVCEVVCSYCEQSSGFIDFQRVSELADTYQMYPHQVKKDKNQSTGMQRVLNSKNEGGSTPHANLRLAGVLEFIWDKISERYYTMAAAFRYFDIRNAGRISKSDFIQSLETLKIKLTTQDITEVFDYLD